MKAFLSILFTSLVACFFLAGCSDDDMPKPEQETGIVIQLSTGAMETKSILMGSYNLHNVSSVYAILYKGEGDDATYVCHQDLNWDPKSDTGQYGEGISQTKSFDLNTPTALTDGAYTILCVGLDDKSGETYQVSFSPSFCAAGKTLKDAKAAFAEEKRVDDMRQSELFAGWAQFDYANDRLNTVKIEMKRRVTGVYAYLKDIPTQVNGQTVAAIELVLGQNRRTELPLARKERSETNPSAIPEDFATGNEVDDSQVLDRLDLNDEVVEEDASSGLFTTLKEYYTQFETTYTPALAEGAILLSGYLLPMEYEEGGSEPMLSVRVLDENDDVIGSFPAQWEGVPTEAGFSDKFNLYPNYVYHVGTRDVYNDHPESLAGDKLLLEVQDWDELTINTDFPKVPLEAQLDYTNGYNQSAWIFDCINTEDKITVTRSLMKKNWSLTVVSVDAEGNVDLETSCDWLYFKIGNALTQELNAEDNGLSLDESHEITIVLNDYVVQRDYDPSTTAGQQAINNDYRSARIVLQTTDGGEDYLLVRQYNAITVKFENDYTEDGGHACGFSRFDYGAKRDKDGNVIEEGEEGYENNYYAWGYYFLEFYSIDLIYDDSGNNSGRCSYGAWCYSSMEERNGSEGDRYYNYWMSSLVKLLHYPAVEYGSNGINSVPTYFWYLPSLYELYHFFQDIVKNVGIDNAHILPNQCYWSASAKRMSLETNYVGIGENGELMGKHYSDENDYDNAFERSKLGLSRRARKFK